MSSFETIANIRSLSTSQRSLTPSKIPLRNITPQKVSSNPRNLSSGKSRFGDGNHGVDMADSQPRAPSRSASRRKQRRWENQNIFSAEVNDILLQGLDDEDTHIKIRKPLFKVELRSAFRELFEPKNAGVLEAFRLCAESVDQQHFINSKHQHLSERDKAWFRIERRLRKILIQSVTKNVDILSFVADVEEILIAFLSGRTAFCDGNNREESRVLQSLLVNVPLINNDKNLEIELKDSAFHRLLLHSVCQYHGLASKSFQKLEGLTKVTIVSKSKNMDYAAPEEKDCLTKYLFDKVMTSLSFESKPDILFSEPSHIGCEHAEI